MLSHNTDSVLFVCHHSIMLALFQLFKDLLHYLTVLFWIHCFLYKIESIDKAAFIINVRKHGACQMIVRIINRSIGSFLDELTLVFLQDNIPDIASLITAKLQEIVLKDPADNIQQRN